MSNNRLKKSAQNHSTPRKPRTQPQRGDGAETRLKLIKAAGEAFANDGFRSANLREICDNAGANLGSIRYYFGSKEALYREVLLTAYADVSSKTKLHPDNAEGAEMDLEAWIHAFTDAILYRRKEYPYLPSMISRELAHPTEVFDEIVRLFFKPVRSRLLQILAKELALPADSPQLATHANRIIFLCVQTEIMRPLLLRFGSPIPDTSTEVAQLADDIYRFAKYGLAENAQ